MKPVSSYYEPGLPGVNAQLNPRQQLAADPSWSSANPAAAMLYGSAPYQYENDPVYNAGRWTTGASNKLLNMSKIPQAVQLGAIPGALVSGGLAALAGGAGALAGNAGIGLYNTVTGDRKRKMSPLKMALLLGLLGGGAGAYAGWINSSLNKTASFRTSRSFGVTDPYTLLMNKVKQDMSISFNERGQLMRGISQLNQQQADELARVLMTAGGGAIGVIIARYLANAGLGGMVLGGLLGGSIVKSLLTPRDSLGQRIY